MRRNTPLESMVTDEELAKVNIKENKFHGEWNYTIELNN